MEDHRPIQTAADAALGTTPWTVARLVGGAVAAASVASAAIHFSVIGEHYQEAWYFGVFFMIAAWAQVGWAIGIIVRPTRRLLLAGVVLQSLLVATYVWSRTTGLPIGPEPWTPESVAFLDITSTMLEAAAAVGALVLAVRAFNHPVSRRVSVAALGLPVLLIGVLTSASLASASAEANDMSTMSGASANSSMAAMSSAMDSPATLALPTTSPAGNIIWPVSMGQMDSGMEMAGPACTTEPDASQQHAAIDLVNETVAGTNPYRSLAAAKAAGYVPITPTGRSVVHYINPAYYRQTTTPSEVLNPQAPQSLVYANTPHGPVLVAAMYIMPAAAPSTEAPQPGGCLTQWHIHTNLCFNRQSQVTGVDSTGGCASGSSNRTTQPMIHVWLAPVPGGPLTVDVTNKQIIDAAKALPPTDPPTNRA